MVLIVVKWPIRSERADFFLADVSAPPSCQIWPR